MTKDFNFLRNPLADKDTPSRHQVAPGILRALVYPIIFIGVFICALSFQVILSGDGLATEESSERNVFSSFLNALGFADEKPLKGEDEDRINILLTGMGGLGHSGPFLTDTIIVASIQPSTNKVAMLSIPRDLSVSIPGYGWRRINSVNHYGELQNPGDGAAYTANFIGDLLDIPIHYYVRVDFKGFEEVINELGGLDIYVDTSFSDSQFPTDNYGYTTISFTQGWNAMDGVTALNYARSRHGNNGEGSDFARSQRQQKVIKAVKDKLLSVSTIFNLRKVNALYDTYQENVSTNLEPWEMIRFAKMARDIDDSNISTLVLDNGPDGLLYSTMINGAYLLFPRDESYFEIHQVVDNIFNPQEYLTRPERATVEIRNGTKVNGLAYETSVDLTKLGFDVERIGNAVAQDYEKTVIYDLTNGNKQRSLERVKEFFNANVTTNVPLWLTEDAPDDGTDRLAPSSADFLIILGNDYAATHTTL